MNLISLTLLLASPTQGDKQAFKSPSPGPSDLPLRRAQKVAQGFADKAGFKIKVDSLPQQFVVGNSSSKNGYPIEDKRRWYFGGPEFHFVVGAQSGRLLKFRRGNRMDSSHRVNERGLHMSNKKLLEAHALQVARKLGMFKPVKIWTGSLWDDDGRPKLRGSNIVVLMGMRRQVQMNFHPKDGDLMFYSDSADAPNISPRDALKPQSGDISSKMAMEALTKFRRALKLPPAKYEDSFATLQTLLPVRGQRTWHIDHPNCVAEVDGKSGKVLMMRPFSEGPLFKKGDRPFVSSKSEAEHHMRRIVAQIGVPSSAKADVRIINEMVFRTGWVGQIHGTFTWANNTCNVICDLRRGDLIGVDFLKPRKVMRG